MRFLLIIALAIVGPWVRPAWSRWAPVFADGETLLAGAIGAGAAGAVAVAWKLWEIRKGIKEQDREDAVAEQQRKQSDQSFIAASYRKAIRDHQRDYEELRTQFNDLRQVASQEAHGLRDQLQRALLSEAVLKERCATLEREIKAQGGEQP